MKKILGGIVGFGIATLLATTMAQAGGQIGKASYYGLKSRTASGGRVGAFTAAHRSLPMGSRARVTNLRNHRSVVVEVNDRGPFKRDRIIDVSPTAAKSLGFKSTGVAPVEVAPTAK